GTADALDPHRLAELMVGEKAASGAMVGIRATSEGVPAETARTRDAPLPGQRAATGQPRSLTEEEPRGPIRLRTLGLDVSTDVGPSLRDITLRVAGGEVLGIAGVAGSGQRALAETLVGLRKPERGTVEVDGADVTAAPAAAVARGVAYVPD